MSRAEAPGKCLLETSNADAGSPKSRSGWLNIEVTKIGQLMAALKITGVRRWERARNRVFLQPR
ncbi:hypothetical protein DET51_106198 [Marinobacter nauticus]|uniref:Uncharacterized protein n=1 Tax=Marinobacter nauticus TaxID=2743 RepID=A0A368UZ97_MARNT|nr:hypothetical protein DET51_106198 [Marinobacter nauticus]